jgi:glyoxylase-like metal-dependent hydrolase (beta-lactamase superfamily II)
MSEPIRSQEVAEGIYRFATKWVNFYLVVDDDRGLLVDAGYPRYWKQLRPTLDAVGVGARPIDVIVTHHHVDHAGTAHRLTAEREASVFVHPADAPAVRGERRSHVPPGFYRQAWRPSMLRYLGHTVRAGGARYRPVPEAQLLELGVRPELAGAPTVIHTPGHTAGHCSVLLADRGVLFSGDAMVNFDYASGRHGLALHRFNEHRDQAFKSLEAFEPVDADLMLFGHGDPWTRGVDKALETVRVQEVDRSAAH